MGQSIQMSLFTAFFNVVDNNFHYMNSLNLYKKARERMQMLQKGLFACSWRQLVQQTYTYIFVKENNQKVAYRWALIQKTSYSYLKRSHRKILKLELDSWIKASPNRHLCHEIATYPTKYICSLISLVNAYNLSLLFVKNMCKYTTLFEWKWFFTVKYDLVLSSERNTEK